MKKTLLAIMAFAAVTMSACDSKDTYTTDASVLPAGATKMINANFPGVKVAQIKVDKETMGDDEYEVTLSNGTTVEFKADGSIDKVKAGNNDTIPTGLLPAPVKAYLAANYAGEKVVKYDVDSNDQEVKLSNGLELKFDLQGNFLKIDK